MFDDLGLGSIGDFCAASPAYCISLSNKEYAPVPGSTRFSLIRTGTGDLLLQCRQRLWADAFNCTHAVLHSNSAFG